MQNYKQNKVIRIRYLVLMFAEITKATGYIHSQTSLLKQISINNIKNSQIDEKNNEIKFDLSNFIDEILNLKQ